MGGNRDCNRGAKIISIVLCGGLLACGDTATVPCLANADCVSGECRPDGVCAPSPEAPNDTALAQGADAAQDALSVAGDVPTLGADAAHATDSGQVEGEDGGAAPGPSDVGAGVCLPNQNGEITRAEIPLGPGLSASYLIAGSVEVDTTGTTAEDGTRVWDLSGDLSGDQTVLVETLDPSLWWFDAVFPDATYAVRLRETADALGAFQVTADSLGVFQVTADDLLLLGVVSPEDGPLRTELIYDPPAKMLTWPLEQGGSWTSTSTVSGLIGGVPAAWDFTETYTGEVDATGELHTPFGDFPVLRVAVALERTVAMTPYTEQQLLFVTECFGTVGSVRSEGYETEVEFSTAAEVRRLTLTP